MNIRNKKFQSHDAEVKTDALNDILFILLFFFLLMAMIANPDVLKLSQPKASNTEKNNKDAVVNFKAEGQQVIRMVGTLPVKNDSEFVDELVKQLALTKNKVPTVAINADSSVPVFYVTQTMTICNRLKAKTVLVASKN
jgi:biopolymer transport protein ExbD